MFECVCVFVRACAFVTGRARRQAAVMRRFDEHMAPGAILVTSHPVSTRVRAAPPAHARACAC